jgi:hypothetical protein
LAGCAGAPGFEWGSAVESSGMLKLDVATIVFALRIENNKKKGEKTSQLKLASLS